MVSSRASAASPTPERWWRRSATPRCSGGDRAHVDVRPAGARAAGAAARRVAHRDGHGRGIRVPAPGAGLRGYLAGGVRPRPRPLRHAAGDGDRLFVAHLARDDGHEPPRRRPLPRPRRRLAAAVAARRGTGGSARAGGGLTWGWRAGEPWSG